MSKELYVVYFESANYAGYGEHCLVWAEDVESALADEHLSEHTETFYREQDEEEYIDEYGEDDSGVMWASIMTAVPLKGSEFEKWVSEAPDLYPTVN